MHTDNVSTGTFLAFFAMTVGAAWFWSYLRYAVFGERLTGQWLSDARWGIPMLWLRTFGIPFVVAIFAELWVEAGPALAGFHPLNVFVGTLIGVLIDWILYGIGEGLHHRLPTAEEPQPARP